MQVVVREGRGIRIGLPMASSDISGTTGERDSFRSRLRVLWPSHAAFAPGHIPTARERPAVGGSLGRTNRL